MPPTRSAHAEQGEGAGLLQGSLTSLCMAEAHLAAAQSLQQSPHKQDGCVQGALRQHAGRCSVLAASCQLQLLEDDQATLALQACSCTVVSLLQAVKSLPGIQNHASLVVLQIPSDMER